MSIFGILAIVFDAAVILLALIAGLRALLGVLSWLDAPRASSMFEAVARETRRALSTERSLLLALALALIGLVASLLLLRMQDEIPAALSGGLGFVVIAGKFLGTNVGGGVIGYYTQKVLRQREKRRSGTEGEGE